MDGAAQDISLENFDAAIEFLTRHEPAHIGIIGGEPTLHPQFDEILGRLIDNPCVPGVTIYTNGILLGNFTNLITHPKISLLVNWNSPQALGVRVFEVLRDNVDKLIFEHAMAPRLNLGLNLYDISMDYTYMVELLKRYRLRKLRISLTVPDFPEGCGTDVLEYFRGYKTFLMSFFRDMDTIGVLPYYDCNRPPYCIWTEEEKRWLESYTSKYSDLENTLVDTKSFCRPPIDILPDLQAVRCFGMSFFEKVSIADFSSYEDLVAHFMRLIDARAYRVSAAEECKDCYLRRTWLCCQGCMGFKSDIIREMIAEAER